MRRARLMAAATALAATAMVSGCGDDAVNSGDLTNDMDDYCAAVEDLKGDFDNLDDADFGRIGEMRDAVGDIADQAPDSVEAEWRTLEEGLGQVVDVLNEVGIDPADLNNPGNIDPAKLQELQQLASEVDTAALDDAGNAITQEVKADCGINLEG